MRFDLADSCTDLLGDLVEDLRAELGVEHLAPSEHDRDLDLVTLGQELGDLAGLGVEVALPIFGRYFISLIEMLDDFFARLLGLLASPRTGTSRSP